MSFPTSSLRKGQRGVALVELVIVVAIGLIVSGMAVPSFVSIRRNYRTLGDARDLHSMILLAKMRAAANFTRTRVKFNLNARTFQLEVWERIGTAACAVNTWCAEGGAQLLSNNVQYGFGSLATGPSTQPTLAQAPGCVPGTSGGSGNPGGGAADTTTACMTFNSRGIPVDDAGSPVGPRGIYITDTASIYGTTVTIVGQTQAWRSEPNVAAWVKR